MQAVTKRTFTAEFRAEAVKLVSAQGLTQSEVARRLDISSQTLHNWVKLSKADKLGSINAKRLIAVSPIEAENSRLKPRSGGAERRARHLKKSDGILRETVAVKYAFIERQRLYHRVTTLCRVITG